VWDYWIIYPAIAWALLTAADAWWVFGRKPISETAIRREIERQGGHAELKCTDGSVPGVMAALAAAVTRPGTRPIGPRPPCLHS